MDILGESPGEILPDAENPAGSMRRLNVTPTETEGFFAATNWWIKFDGQLVDSEGFVDVPVGQTVRVDYAMDFQTIDIVDGTIAGSFTLDVSLAPWPLPAAFWLLESGLLD